MSRSPGLVAPINEAINILRECVAAEMASSVRSDHQGRVSDEGSLEAQKRQGYF